MANGEEGREVEFSPGDDEARSKNPPNERPPSMFDEWGRAFRNKEIVRKLVIAWGSVQAAAALTLGGPPEWWVWPVRAGVAAVIYAVVTCVDKRQRKGRD